MSGDERCPSKPTLEAYSSGRLDSDEAARIAHHLQGCADCARQFNQTADPGATVSVPTRAIGSGDADPLGITGTRSFDSSEHVAKTLGDERFDYSVLAPSEHARSFGRLDKYDVIREIGHGGYGIVFEGWDGALHRPVAIKVLNRELRTSPVARRRFLREARAAAAINHPNVVTIHDVEEHQGMPFLVMELVSGGSLRDRIRTGQRPGIFEVLRIGAQVAEGLAAAHAQGVIHRDIKPGNIMLEDGLERVKITDFGLARVAIDNLDLTPNEIMVGTPTYMSPEQARGAPVDKRSDLFSLGCVLYAMCTGHSPFHGRTALEVAHRVANEEPQPLHIVTPEFPKFLSDVVQRLLKKSPDERFQSASELADLLKNHLSVLNQTPSDELATALYARDADVPEPQPLRRKKIVPRVAIGLGIVALLLVGTWMGGLWPTKRSGILPVNETGKGSLPLKSSIDVAKSGEADAQTIAAALEQIAPGGIIRVRDDAEYDEAIALNDPARWQGVTIEATAKAVLRATSGQPLLRIDNVPKITIRGFQLKLPNHQRGIDVVGLCPGLLLEDLHAVTDLQDVTNVPIGFGYLHNGAAGTEESPMIVRRLSLSDRKVGMVIGEQGGRPTEPVRWLRIEDSRLIGPQSGGAFHCVLFGGIEHVTLHRVIFAQGQCGMSIAAGSEGGANWLRDLVIEHCTFYELSSWFHWAGPVAPSERVQFQQNLVVRTKGFTFQQAESETVTQNWFSNNWAESTDSSPNVYARTFSHIPLRTTDPASADYLRPAKEGVLADVQEPIPGFHSTISE